MGCSHAVFYVSFILVWFLAILRTTDAVASVTWYEPPPVETVTDENLIQTHKTQLREGSINVALNWNFSVAQELTFAVVNLRFDSANAASILPSTGAGGAVDPFKERFNVSGNSQYATLIILNVTAADEGVFSCELNTFEVATNKIWIRNIQVTVVDPPSITGISGNRTVTVGDVVTLICTVDGRPTPTANNITWTRLSDNSVVTFPLNITGIQDEGTYRCTVDNGIGKPVSRDASITVQIPPEFAYVTSDQVICEGTTVTLSCNATGKPAPNITWTRAFDNGTESALQPVVDGKYVINSVMRSSNGTYRCTADNGVDGPVNRTVRLTFGYFASVVRIVNSSNTVNEGGSFNMTCEASGDPKLNVHWIEVDNGQRTDGNILNFPNINRIDAGQYKCEADNVCGSNTTVQTVEVYFKPDTVELLTNTTENTDCSDLWVNFTCNASEANPAVYNFLLYKKDGGISSNKIGTWTEILSVGGQHMYSCQAQHIVENVNSSNIVTLAVNVPASVKPIQNQTVEEGNSTALYCDASRNPDPTVTWSKVGGEVIVEGNWLNFTNINRSEAGQYKCQANNTCGNVSEMASIDAQYKPGNVHLTANITSNKACQGIIVTFTCTSDANPAVDTFLLYENEVMIGNMDGSGVWKGPLNTPGQVIYRCEANNLVGTGGSNNITLNVKVPASVRPIQNKIVKEGNSTALYCNASGNPDPTVTWSKVGGEAIIEGNWLNFTNITKAEAGQYKCQANNTCGRVSTLASIDVQYKPENVHLNVNITKNKTCAGMKVNFTCTSDANPAVDNYKLYENNGMNGDIDRSGVWIMALNTPGQVIYRCEANNSVGTGRAVILIWLLKFQYLWSEQTSTKMSQKMAMWNYPATLLQGLCLQLLPGQNLVLM